MNDSTRPPRIGYTSGSLGLGIALVALAVVGGLDVAGALSSALSGGGAHLVPVSVMGKVLAHLVNHPGSAAAAWPAAAGLRFASGTFWGVFGLLALVLVVLVRLGVRVLHGPGSGQGVAGFAPPALVARVATLRAARRRARQTRPSLVAELPRVFGRPRLSKLAAEDVGYRLGVTREPRRMRLVANWETSLRVVAPPGEGKTERLMRPIGAAHPGPLFATSTKPDLYEGLAAARERRGPVWALDPDGLVPGATPVRWSPVAGCESTRAADRRAGALIAAGADTSDVKSGEFFRSSAKAVLAGLLHAAALGGCSMADVLAWASDPSNPRPVQILSRHDGGKIDWATRLSRHTTGSEVTTSGVMRTLDVALSCFQHDDVLELCSPPPGAEFDFERLIEGNGSVFALGKERAGGVGPLVTAFAEELVYVAEEQASRRPTRRLDPPLMFLLDEVTGIAPLPSLPTLLADGRGRGEVVLYALQSDSQAETRWGTQGAATLRNATTAMCVLGGLKDADDLRELSRLCGTRKVLRHTSSEDARMSGQSVSATWVEEPILEESAIRTLPDGVALVLWAKLPPMLVYLPGSWEGRGARAAAAAEAETRRQNDEARAGLAGKLS